jgi:hypothetical protein
MPISEEQKANRSGRMGSSDSASAVGVNPYSTPFQLYGKLKGMVDPFMPTLATDVGLFMEPFLIKKINDLLIERGEKSTPFMDYGESMFHKKHDWVISHPDGYRINDGKYQILEIKNVGWRVMHHWGEGLPKTGLPPAYVATQVLFQAWVAKNSNDLSIPVSDVHYVGAYFGGNDLRLFRLEFVEENYLKLEEDLLEFWAYMERDEAPPMGWKDAKFAGKMYPRPSVPMIDKSEVKDQGLVKEYLDIRNKMKSNEQALLHKEAKIKEVMKDAEVMVDDDGFTPLFSWKTNKRGTRVFTCKIKE